MPEVAEFRYRIRRETGDRYVLQFAAGAPVAIAEVPTGLPPALFDFVADPVLIATVLGDGYDANEDD